MRKALTEYGLTKLECRSFLVNAFYRIHHNFKHPYLFKWCIFLMLMWNKPTLEELSELPRIDEVLKKKPDQRIVHMHFFAPDREYFVVGYTPEENRFYGEYINTKVDYFSWMKLPQRIIFKRTFGPYKKEYTRNLNWEPQTAYSISEVREIRNIQKERDEHEKIEKARRRKG